MLQQVMIITQGMGLAGLLVIMAIEGSSVPFPGVLFVSAFGYILSPKLTTAAIIAVEMSLVYSIASYVPYWVGRKLSATIAERYEKQIRKAQDWFSRYGELSIAITRPFGMGNYISYIAGMSKTGPFKYGLLTFLGIYPWCYAMLMLGRVFKGNSEAIIRFYRTYCPYIYVGLIAVAIAYIYIVVVLRNRKSVQGVDA